MASWLYTLLTTGFLAFAAASSDATDVLNAALGQPAWNNLCGYNLYNQSQWVESGAGIRLQQIFAEYKEVKGDLDDKNFITGFFMPKYIAGSSIVGGTCNVLQQCNLVSTCLAINQTDPQQEKDHIYAIANSISNLNNALNFHHEAFQDAATQLGHLWPYMEDAFTWKDQVKEYETNRRRVHNDFISFWYKVVNNIFSDLSALNGAITQAGGPDDYGPIAAVITMWIRLFQQNLDFVEFFHKLHLMRATLPAVPAEGWVGQELTNGILSQNNMFQDTMAQLLAGEEFEGHNIATLLMSGTFARPATVNVRKMTDSILERMVGATIDAIWQGEQIWITESDGDCFANRGADRDMKRGPILNEVCLPEEPQKIFHLYSLPKFQEERKHCVTSPATPPGWMKIIEGGATGYHGVTAEKIVRSAISRNRIRGNVPAEVDHDKGMSVAFAKPKELFGADQVGLFNIGVCYTPDGKFVSSLNQKGGRQFPCECQNTNASISDAEAFANFLDLTGLATSKDFFQGCTEKHKSQDRQDCKIDKTGDLLYSFYHRHDPAKFAEMANSKDKQAKQQLKKLTTQMFKDCKEQKGDRRGVGVPQADRSPHGMAKC